MECFFRAAALLLVALVGFVASQDEPTKFDFCRLAVNRLPPLFTPEKYELTLQPDLEALKFNGNVKILTTYTGEMGSAKPSFGSMVKQVCKSTMVCADSGHRMKRRILLNVGKTIAISSIQVFKIDLKGANPEHKPISIEKICYDRSSQLLEVNLARKFHRKDRVLIKVAYKGQIAKESRGLYESLDRVEGKIFETTTNANTHFFPADARSTFPCFDQPDMKASFELTLIHDKNLVSVSNAKVQSETIDEATQMKRVRFEPTPKMSPYVFAFAVGHYETISCQAGGRVKPVVTAYAPLGRSKDARFTLETVCKSIPIIEDYFLLDFPLMKLDLVVTKQMRDPARENWGMIVFTEEFLLTDRDTTNVLRAEIAKLTCHNVLHHWYGNLVTAKWWDDQWIFDGFTIWRSHLVAAAIYPEFDYNFNYLLRLQSPMLDAQADGSRRAIKTYQDLTADKELALFDANSYNKAAAIYHLIHAQLGENQFRDVLATFIARNISSNADINDLNQAIKSVTSLDLSRQIASWTDQPGAPLLSVDRVSSKQLEIKQEPMANYASSGAKKQLWIIPIDVFISDGRPEGLNVTVRTVLDEASKQIDMPSWFDGLHSEHFVKLNANFTGFYRVKYGFNLLDRLRKPIREQRITPEDRFNIIDDLRALMMMNKITVREFETILTKEYKNENDGGVISGLVLAVDDLAKVEDKERVSRIVCYLFEEIYDAFKFKITQEQSHAEMNARQDVLLILIRYNYIQVIEDALEVFDKSDVHLVPFLRKPVYLAVLNHGSDEQVEELFDRLSLTKSPYERQILVAALVPYLNERGELFKERLQEVAMLA